MSGIKFMGIQEDPDMDNADGRGFPRIYDGTGGSCPRCESPRPELHPALAYEGEVQLCEHPWHASTEEGRVRIAKTRGGK